MMHRSCRFALVLAAISLSPLLSPNLYAQGEPATASVEDAKHAGRGTIETRITRQRKRIEEAVQAGTMTKQRAHDLRSGLDQLEAKINTERASNGGKLKIEQLKEAENSLNQSNDVIKSFESAGTSQVNNGKVLGPGWTTGKDGAQNPRALLHQMKQQAKMQDRQYKQAMEQKVEQQQLDYEKDQIKQFQGQREGILNQKQDLKQERQDTGAN